MQAPARPLVAGLGSALFADSAIAATHGAIGAADILLGLLLLCWIGFPLLLLGALAWTLVRSFIASPRRPLPGVRAPDTDLTA